MENTNILLLLTPKVKLAYLLSDMNIRQAYEKMKAHGYMAIPLIDDKGVYLGTIKEGDILHFVVDGKYVLEDLEQFNITKILNPNYNPPVKVDEDFTKLIELVMNQNYVPVIDDRGVLMGIVTRKKVMEKFVQ